VTNILYAFLMAAMDTACHASHPYFMAPVVHYLPQALSQGQINPVCTFPPCFLNIHFNVNLSSMLGSSVGLSPSVCINFWFQT
jgi:hypothetical protein